LWVAPRWRRSALETWRWNGPATSWSARLRMSAPEIGVGADCLNNEGGFGAGAALFLPRGRPKDRGLCGGRDGLEKSRAASWFR